MPTVYQRASARRDLVEHFVYLAENAGMDTAERFLINAEASFNDLVAVVSARGNDGRRLVQRLESTRTNISSSPRKRGPSDFDDAGFPLSRERRGDA